MKDVMNDIADDSKLLTVSVSEDASMVIETVTGRLVNPTNPSVDSINLNDIAWALSRIPRFAGHSITEIPFNVAQHSIYVANLVEALVHGRLEIEIPREVQRAVNEIVLGENIAAVLKKAQLHDAHEAYIGDIPSPIKKIPELRETFKLIERRLDAAIFSHFGLQEMTAVEHTVIKFCDKIAQAIEGYQFMPSRGANWDLPQPTLTMLQKFPAPEIPLHSYVSFISHYEYLGQQ
jgi:hypothetical protein